VFGRSEPEVFVMLPCNSEVIENEFLLTDNRPSDEAVECRMSL